MIIGVARENREKNERRVVLLPKYVKTLVEDGNIVLVEKNAGEKLGINDQEYEKNGAKISLRNDVYCAEIVLRIRAPTLEELKMMKKGSLLVCMVHRDNHPELIKEFRRREINVLELNEIKNDEGKRLIEAFALSASEGIKAGFDLFQKLYKKIPVRVVIMGYGNIAQPAIAAACRLGAVVKVLGRKQTSRRFIKDNLREAEILINATYRKPEEIGKYLIKKEDLLVMDKNSLILDFSADPISCIETCHPTSLDNPYYFVSVNQRRIPHMCIYSLPGLSPLKCSKRYGRQILPIIRLIAKIGLTGALNKQPNLNRALIKI